MTIYKVCLRKSLCGLFIFIYERPGEPFTAFHHWYDVPKPAREWIEEHMTPLHHIVLEHEREVWIFP